MDSDQTVPISEGLSDGSEVVRVPFKDCSPMRACKTMVFCCKIRTNYKLSQDIEDSPDFVFYPFMHSSEIMATFQPTTLKLSHDSSLENVPHITQGNPRTVQDFEIFGCDLNTASGNPAL